MQAVLIRAGCFVGMILLGYVLKCVGLFKKEDFKILSKVVLKLTLPAAIIVSFAGSTIDPAMLTVTLLGFGGGVIYILAAYLVNLKNSREQRAFEVLNLPGYNIGCFTMPFAQSFLGPVGVITTSLFDTGNAFVCLGGSLGVAKTIQEGKGIDLKRLFQTLLTSVPFLCYIIMTALNLAEVTLPDPVLSFVGYIGNANAFLAMFMIGIGFELHFEKHQLGSILRVLVLRYAIAAALAVLFYFALPLSQEIRTTLVVLVFSPIGSAVPAFTEEMKGDVALSSTINSICMIISIVIMVAMLAIL